MKRLESGSREVIGQMLNARLMADRREGIGRAGWWFCWVFSTVTVDLIEMLGLRVIGL